MKNKNVQKNIFITASASNSRAIKEVDENHEKTEKRKSSVVKSHYLIKNEEMFEKATSDILDFMVNEETEYTDLFKIREYFESKVIQDRFQYNENQCIMDQKEKELEMLTMQIEEMLVSQFQFQMDDASIAKQFDDIRKQIEIQSHSLQVYETTYVNAYQENYMLKQTLLDNIQHLQQNDKHYDKYAVIKRTAERELKLQCSLFSDMQFFEIESKDYFSKELEKQKGRYTKLEFEIKEIKSHANDKQRELNSIDDKIKLLETMLPEQVRRNSKQVADLRNARSEYLQNKIKMLKIYQSLKVNDLDSIIKRFKEEIIQYHGSSSLYHNLLKEISKLSHEYSSYQKQYNEIQSKIHERKPNHVNQNIDDVHIEKFQVQIATEVESNKSILVAGDIKENILKDLMNFILKYEKKMSDIVKSVSIANLKLANLSSRKIEEKILKNGDKSIAQMEAISKMSCWGINECKNILHLYYQVHELMTFFLKFQRKVYFVCLNFMVDISVHFFNEKQISKLVIFGVPCQIAEEITWRRLKMYEEQAAFQRGSSTDIINDKNTTEKKKEIVFSKKATLNMILNRYYDHLNKSTVDSTSIHQLLEKLQNKFFSNILKYTNDFVEPLHTVATAPVSYFNSQTINNAIKTVPTQQIGDSTYQNAPHSLFHKSFTRTDMMTQAKSDESKPTANKQQTETALKLLNPMYSILPKEQPSLDDSYKDEEPKHEIVKKEASKNYYGYSNIAQDHVTDMYKRINDMRQIELKMFKSKANKHSNQKDFDEIYYNFKKKLNTKAFQKITENFRRKKNKANNTRADTVVTLESEKLTNKNTLIGWNTIKTTSTLPNAQNEHCGLVTTASNDNTPNVEKKCRASSQGIRSKNKGNITTSTYKSNDIVKDLFNDRILAENQMMINSYKQRNQKIRIVDMDLEQYLSRGGATRSKGLVYLPSVTESTKTPSFTNYYANTKFGSK